uniref:HSP17.6B n=1 Tax=Selenicereus monacanthus TaxID=1195128 RepID=A0AA50CIF1_9CARY|nr:HSP17.6B [Selenicereus monacanthus]
MLLHYYHVPENYVHWRETPDSHIYSADLPGVRKEEIKVEAEDSTYLIIRTEAIVESLAPSRRFMRKFRLPGWVDVDGISAGYEDGVLIITVPRREFHVDPALLAHRLEVTARAA